MNINNDFNGALTDIHNKSFNQNHRTTLGHFSNNSLLHIKNLIKTVQLAQRGCSKMHSP